MGRLYLCLTVTVLGETLWVLHEKLSNLLMVWGAAKALSCKLLMQRVKGIFFRAANTGAEQKLFCIRLEGSVILNIPQRPWRWRAVVWFYMQTLADTFDLILAGWVFLVLFSLFLFICLWSSLPPIRTPRPLNYATRRLKAFDSHFRSTFCSVRTICLTVCGRISHLYRLTVNVFHSVPRFIVY